MFLLCSYNTTAGSCTMYNLYNDNESLKINALHYCWKWIQKQLFPAWLLNIGMLRPRNSWRSSVSAVTMTEKTRITVWYLYSMVSGYHFLYILIYILDNNIDGTRPLLIPVLDYWRLCPHCSGSEVGLCWGWEREA